jgi:N-glycosylase/DNA lyase
LQNVRSQWPGIEDLLAKHQFIENRTYSRHMKSVRDELAATIDGIGMKESSHFLRNIGARGLAIIDRHLLENLVRRGVFSKSPKIGTVKAYREVEEAFSRYSNIVGIDSDVLDLLFWSENTGYVGK